MNYRCPECGKRGPKGRCRFCKTEMMKECAICRQKNGKCTC